eukprot:gene5295-3798_t
MCYLSRRQYLPFCAYYHIGLRYFSSAAENSPYAENKEADVEVTYDEIDPLQTLEKVARRGMDDVRKIQEEEKKAGEEAAPSPGGSTVDASQKRRRLRRRRTMDNILGDVLNDALRLRDMGKKPSVDFIYKRTQERLYEEEYGKKPPSAKEHAAKYIPFPPDFHLHRILPLFPSEDAPDCSNLCYIHSILLTDPWPERAITPSNPVWTKGQVEEDKHRANGQKLREWEKKMFHPREGYDIMGEFLDASDELAHWEAQLLNFLRTVPLTQRRSLPYLHEWYRIFVHRSIRAERRYMATRDAALASVKADTTMFKRTEERIDRIRAIYAEAHRSLSSANYDPMRMKKSTLAPFMQMNDREFFEWQETEKHRRQILIAELT